MTLFDEEGNPVRSLHAGMGELVQGKYGAASPPKGGPGVQGRLTTADRDPAGCCRPFRSQFSLLCFSTALFMVVAVTVVGGSILLHREVGRCKLTLA